MYQSLLGMTEMDISYLSTLDYLDIKSICKISKQYEYICQDDTLLKNILINKNDDIVMTRDINVAVALEDIYREIENLIYKNYSTTSIPDWVNKERFIIYMIKIIRDEFVDTLVEEIVENTYDGGLFMSDMNINIYKSTIAFQFHTNKVELSIELDELLDATVNDLIHTIVLPELFQEYINPTLINVYNKYDDETYYNRVEKAILDLLFMSK